MKKKVCFYIISLVLLVSGTANSQSFTNYTSANGLPDNNVNGVAVDSNNVKWFGTQSGVARFNDVTWQVFTTADGLVDNYINCIAVDKNNHVWVGTDIGACFYNGLNWKTYTTADGLINNTISYITAGADGNVWIGTGSGMSKFDGTTFTNYTTSNGLPSNMVSYIAVDGSNNVWIGTWIGGLAKFDGSTFRTFTTLDGLPVDNITSIAIDKAGNKYVGTFSGVAVLDSTDTFVRNFTSANGLFNNYVQDLDLDSHSQVWAAIYADYLQEGGLSRYNQATWSSFSVGDGLVNNLVRRLTVDKTDHVWIATGQGVSDYYPGSYGISEIAMEAGSVYPNPAHEQLVIRHKNNDSVLSLYDATGKESLTSILTGENTCIDIQSLQPGIYLLRIRDANKVYSSKIIIQ